MIGISDWERIVCSDGLRAPVNLTIIFIYMTSPCERMVAYMGKSCSIRLTCSNCAIYRVVGMLLRQYLAHHQPKIVVLSMILYARTQRALKYLSIA